MINLIHVHKIKQQFKNPCNHFSKIRIMKKINHFKDTMHNTPAPNAYERRRGQTRTPFMQGKIQFRKLRKQDNIQAVKNELIIRGLEHQILPEHNWTQLCALLKQNENDAKYFKPLTSMNQFVICD